MIIIKEINVNEYKDLELTYNYVSDGYYQVLSSEDNFTFSFQYIEHKEKLDKTFKDVLVPDYIERPYAFIAYDGNNEVGFLTLGIESWNNRLRVWNILVKQEYRNKGIGTLLMNKAKEMMKITSSRQIILETQSCNNKAINFYLKSGFRLVGFDLGNYTNFDILKKEVRLEFAYDTLKDDLDDLEIRLLNEIKQRPKMEEIDLLKYIYQGEFGPGHIVIDKESALEYLKDEMEDIKDNSDNLIEEINKSVIRVNLAPYKHQNKNLNHLTKMLVDSSFMIKGSPYSYHLKVKTLIRLISKNQLNFDINKINELYNVQLNNDFKPFSHSDTYRITYKPHYRVVKKSKYYMYNLEICDIKGFNINNILSLTFIDEFDQDIVKYEAKYDNGLVDIIYVSDITNYYKLKEISDRILIIDDKDLVIFISKGV